MLNEEDIIGKLYDQAEIFKHHMRRKEYLEAALCVDTASMIAHKLEIPEDIRREIFGDRQLDEPVPGLIDEEAYLKACEWCIFHGYSHTRHTYENVMRTA